MPMLTEEGDRLRQPVDPLMKRPEALGVGSGVHRHDSESMSSLSSEHD